MGKKKATGMSKRLGFTDRATISENKDILRYNERLEREAQGLPPEAPRGRPRTDRGGSTGPERGSRPERGGRPERAARPPREPRPPRPPALDEEQVAALRAAYLTAVGESGLDPAAEQVVTALLGHASFERATMTGWEAASGGHADDRTAEQWELLRVAWLRVRLALLEAYVLIKPEAQDQLDRERKQQARLAKPQRPRKRPGRAPGERRPPRASKRTGAPSPADLARRAAAPATAEALETAETTQATEPVEGSAAGPAEGDTAPERPDEAPPAEVETDVPPTEVETDAPQAEPDDAGEPDSAPAEPVDTGGADPATDPPLEPGPDPVVEEPATVAAEHEVYAPAEPSIDDDQLALDL